MYSTCLFCSGALGRNEALEYFPVGRRLAFDAAKGRLWVVCPRCERWNLTPLETRWEAIEEAERAYRGMKLRASTDNIGLARLSEGLELVRVGAPPLPEFVSWRYGDQFGKRHRKHVAVVGSGLIAAIILPLAPMFISVPAIATAVMGVKLSWDAAFMMRMRRRNKRITATVRSDSGELIPLTASNIASAAVVRDSTDNSRWHLALPVGPVRSVDDRFREMNRRGLTAAYESRAELSGASAIRALATMLPHVNEQGAKKRHVRDAVDVITATADAESLVREALKAPKEREFGVKEGEHYVARLAPPIRLALEIMLHQDDERRAMQGELRELEMRWRDAEAIASIADSLTLPPDIEERIAAFKRAT